jgi:hypothetical protein
VSCTERYSSQFKNNYCKRFRGGLAFKAHRWLHHATLGSRVIQKKEKNLLARVCPPRHEQLSKLSLSPYICIHIYVYMYI